MTMRSTVERAGWALLPMAHLDDDDIQRDPDEDLNRDIGGDGTIDA